MSTTKSLLNVSWGLGTIALANENLKLTKKKKVTTKDIVSTGMKNIVGTSLLLEQHKLIESLD